MASPDGKKEAFIRNHNLYVRDVGAGEARPLSYEGAEDDAYAPASIAWSRVDQPPRSQLRRTRDGAVLMTLEEADASALGALLLIVGELDRNVPPTSTLQVVDALIEADKTFDLLYMPGRGHTSGGAYGERRRFDFFAEHLLGAEPPDWNRRTDEAAQGTRLCREPAGGARFHGRPQK